MDISKFTERAQGFLQNAQMNALKLQHQRILPEHLLKAMLDDSEGMASNLIKASGGDAGAVKRGVEQSLEKMPKVYASGNAD